jgi:hypothetical protein
MSEPANEAARALHRRRSALAAKGRRYLSLQREILVTRATAEPVPTCSAGTARRQQDHPEAQIPIAHRMRPAGSCMLGFRTLKRPKSFDKADIRRAESAPRNLPFIHLVGVPA